MSGVILRAHRDQYNYEFLHVLHDMQEDVCVGWVYVNVCNVVHGVSALPL